MATVPRTPQKPFISRETWTQFVGVAAESELSGPRALEIALNSYARGRIPRELIADIEPGPNPEQINMRISADVWGRANRRREEENEIRHMATLVGKLIGAVIEKRLSLVVEVLPTMDPRSAVPHVEVDGSTTPSLLAAA